MRAVVRRGPALYLETVPDPVPGEGQILVKTLACGICGSDLHALHHAEHMVELANKSGGHKYMDPSKDVVFGHEFCAEVLDTGPNTEARFKPGTKICSVPITFSANGPEIVGYSNDFPGGYGEQMTLLQDLCFEVPNGLSAQHAALTEPFAVGEHAVAKAHLGPDTVPMVIGCGPVGISVIAALKARGVGPVIAADFSPVRRKMAETFGADEVIDPAEISPHARWKDLDVPPTLTEKIMADVTGSPYKRAIIFECVGVPGLLQQLIVAAPPETEIVVVGVCMESDAMEPFIASDKEIDMRFVFGYSAEEFEQTLRHLAEGVIDGGPLITGTVGLEGVAGAFEELSKAQTHAKIMVEP